MRRKFRREVIGLFTIAFLLGGAMLTFAKWRDSQKPRGPYVFPAAELAALDLIVQRRFAVIPESDFGIGRIGKRHEVFKPDTSEEKAAVAALRKRKWDVVFYVASHQYLTERLGRQGLNFLQGPVFITSPQKNPNSQTPYSFDESKETETPVTTLPRDLPGGDDIVESPLKEVAQEAYDAFYYTEGMDFNSGEWKITTRPVRASQQACLNCHFKDNKPMKLGDTLGVAMYAYRPARPEINGQITMTAGQKNAWDEADVVFMGTVTSSPWGPSSSNLSSRKIEGYNQYIFQMERYWKTPADNGTQNQPLRIPVYIKESQRGPFPRPGNRYLIYATLNDERYEVLPSNCRIWDPQSDEARALSPGRKPTGLSETP